MSSNVDALVASSEEALSPTNPNHFNNPDDHSHDAGAHRTYRKTGVGVGMPGGKGGFGAFNMEDEDEDEGGEALKHAHLEGDEGSHRKYRKTGVGSGESKRRA